MQDANLALDATLPQGTIPGGRKSKTKQKGQVLSQGHVRYQPLDRYAFQIMHNKCYPGLRAQKKFSAPNIAHRGQQY